MNLDRKRMKLIWFHSTYGKIIELRQERITINPNFWTTTKNIPLPIKLFLNKTKTKLWWIVLRLCSTKHTVSSSLFMTSKYTLKCHVIRSIINNLWYRLLQHPVIPNNKDFWTRSSVHLWSTTWPSRNTLNIKYTRISTLNCIKIYKLINIIIDISLILLINS